VKWLIPRLYDFHARWPNTEVRLTTTDAINESTHTRYDVVITADSGKFEKLLNKKSTNRITLFPERLGPVLSPTLAARMKIRKCSDLKGKTLL
jgi:LysR family transcriptional regulator, glycine cleavage system transcriptional activator